MLAPNWRRANTQYMGLLASTASILGFYSGLSLLSYLFIVGKPVQHEDNIDSDRVSVLCLQVHCAHLQQRQQNRKGKHTCALIALAATAAAAGPAAVYEQHMKYACITSADYISVSSCKAQLQLESPAGYLRIYRTVSQHGT
jgi:hypothetical protein